MSLRVEGKRARADGFGVSRRAPVRCKRKSAAVVLHSDWFLPARLFRRGMGAACFWRGVRYDGQAGVHIQQAAVGTFFFMFFISFSLSRFLSRGFTFSPLKAFLSPVLGGPGKGRGFLSGLSSTCVSLSPLVHLPWSCFSHSIHDEKVVEGSDRVLSSSSSLALRPRRSPGRRLMYEYDCSILGRLVSLPPLYPPHTACA